MIMTRIQPFCRANNNNNNNNLGYFDGTRTFPRSNTDRNNALFLHNNHFCLIWKSEVVSFNHAIPELKENFKVVDTYKTEENVNSHFIYDFIQKKLNIT